jgi:hypothetical protein
MSALRIVCALVSLSASLWPMICRPVARSLRLECAKVYQHYWCTDAASADRGRQQELLRFFLHDNLRDFGTSSTSLSKVGSMGGGSLRRH